MPGVRPVMSFRDSEPAISSLAPDARRWRFEGLSGLDGREIDSDESFRLRFLVGETEVSSSSVPRFIDPEMRPGDVSTVGAGGCLRRLTDQYRKILGCQDGGLHVSFSSFSESSS